MNNRINRVRQHTRNPIIGRIKVGYKDPKTGYPKSTDYFIPTGNFAPVFNQKIGDKPSSIKVVFIDEKTCITERYEYRNNSGDLVAYGDGLNFNVWDGAKYAEYAISDYPDIQERVHDKNRSKKGWEIVLTLNFFILETNIVGLWSFTTKGDASTIPNITRSIDNLKECGGRIEGIPFILSVQFAKSQKPNTTSRYPVISLTADLSQVDNAQINFNQKQLGE